MLAFLQDLGVEGSESAAPAAAEFSFATDDAPAADSLPPASFPPRADASGDADMLQYFVPETEEYCENMEAALAAWEQAPDATEPRLTFLRLFHTIKGAANSIGLTALGGLAHALEGAFEGERAAADDSDDESAAPLRPALATAQQRRLAATSIEVIRDFLRHVGAGHGGEIPPRAAMLLAEIERLQAETAAPPAEPASAGETRDATERAEPVAEAARPGRRSSRSPRRRLLRARARALIPARSTG